MMTLRTGRWVTSGVEGRRRAGFTLIELICVMSLLVITLALVAPSLGRFFRGRTVDSEVRRFLSLTVYAQTRAVSEGMPMLLWVDPEQRAYGLQAESSFQTADGRSVAYAIDRDVRVEIETARVVAGRTTRTPAATLGTMGNGGQFGRNTSVIRFQPDGFIGESSPWAVGFSEAERPGEREDARNQVVWVAQSLNRWSYEVQTNLSYQVHR